MEKCKHCAGKGYITQITPVLLRMPAAIFFGFMMLVGVRIRKPGKVQAPITCKRCGGTGKI